MENPEIISAETVTDDGIRIRLSAEYTVEVLEHLFGCCAAVDEGETAGRFRQEIAAEVARLLPVAALSVSRRLLGTLKTSVDKSTIIEKQ